MNVIDIMRSPLTQKGQTGPFLRLVLAEAASYGMPAQVLATLDDVAAMLGFYEPLTKGQASYMAGPVSTWRSSPEQPTYERVHDLESLAIKQRALNVFGGAPSNHRVGTAEITIAMGNTHKEVVPPEFYEVFQWAAADALATVRSLTQDEVRKVHKWPVIKDEDVLMPTGRLHKTYQHLADHIRRASIDGLRDDPEAPRARLRPLAEHFITVHELRLKDAQEEGQSEDYLERIRTAIKTIRMMYPELITTAPAAAAG